MTDAHKAQAKALRHVLQQHGHTVKHGHALEAVAAFHNLPDWNTLAARPQARPLQGEAALRAVTACLSQRAGVHLDPEGAAQLLIHLDGNVSVPSQPPSDAWTSEEAALARFVVLTARRLTTDGIQEAITQVGKWLAQGRPPLTWQSGDDGVAFLTVGGEQNLPSALHRRMQKDWVLLEKRGEIEGLAKYVVPGLAFHFPSPLVKSQSPVDELLWVLAFLTAYCRAPNAPSSLSSEVYGLALSDLPRGGGAVLPAGVRTFLTDPIARLQWPEARHTFADHEDNLPDLSDAQREGNLYRLLNPLERWAGAPAAVLRDLMNRYEPDVTSDQLAYELGAADEAADIYLDLHPNSPYRRRELVRACRALRVKVQHPEMTHPRSLVVKMAEAGIGRARGTVLFSATETFPEGASFEEDHAFIPQGAQFQHQETGEYLYTSGGKVVHNYTIRHGEEFRLPERRAGQLLVFSLPG